MRLRVRLFAVLRERVGARELDLDGLPEELDVAGLKRELSLRYPAFGDLSHVAGVVGTEYVGDATRLRAGDLVSLLPPVSGGAPGSDPGGDPGGEPCEPPGEPPDGESLDLEHGVFELSADPIDAGRVGLRVGHPGCGATVVFTGTTRDTHRGQVVRHLDYEAFEEMAGPEMRRIFEDCRGLWSGEPPLLRMLCVHRSGRVGVGEPSVVIAVASPHRDAAFAAARYLIDTLKERLPVWKKEVYADGHHWIGDRS